MPDDREPRINNHVERLNRYLPFSTAHEQIYEEYQSQDDSLNLSTEALNYSTKAIANGARCIVLTGDAGHGKTHLCRRLLEDVLGWTPTDSRKLLTTQCNGEAVIAHATDHGKPGLRIHKDFSEMDPGRAADLLEGIRNGEVMVVCANEGRLRAVVQSKRAGDVCKQIISLFEQSFTTGQSSIDGQVHIVNLNYQSVSASSTEFPSLFRRTLKAWVDHESRWRICGTCSLAETCPIRRNRFMLKDDGELSERRILGLEEIFQTVERLGQVITIREMLMLVAYLVTGGLNCARVRIKTTESQGKPGWQHDWAWYNLMFASPPRLDVDRLHRAIPVMAMFARLDPGAIASSNVDDKLLNIGGVFAEGQLDLAFVFHSGNRSTVVDASLGIDDFLGSPNSRAEKTRQEAVSQGAVRALRRRSFFDEREGGQSLMTRLGFRHGDEFLGVIEDRCTSREQVLLKNLVIGGLHTLQGLRLQHTNILHLVDPAFGKASGNAAIIAKRIQSTKIQLIPARKAWSDNQGEWKIQESVDWIDRTVVVRVANDNSSMDIGLDLLSFECVTRAASGHVSEEFYSHEIRRIRSHLSKLASIGAAETGEIVFYVNGRPHNVSIDHDVIQVAEA